MVKTNTSKRALLSSTAKKTPAAASTSSNSKSLLSSSCSGGVVVGMGDVLASLSLNDSDDDDDDEKDVKKKDMKTTSNRNRTTNTTGTRTVRPSRSAVQQKQQYRAKVSAAVNSSTATTIATTSTTTNRKPIIRRKVILDDSSDDDDEEEELEKENHQQHSPPSYKELEEEQNHNNHDDDNDSTEMDDVSEEDEEENRNDDSVVGAERSSSDGADTASYDNDDDSNENDNDDGDDEVDESDSIIDDDEDNDSEEALDDSSFELDGSSNNRNSEDDDADHDDDDADISDVSYLDPDADEIRPLSLIQKQQQKEHQHKMMTPTQTCRTTTTPTPKQKKSQLTKLKPQQQPNHNRSKPINSTARTNSTLKAIPTNQQTTSSSSKQQQQSMSTPTKQTGSKRRTSKDNKNHEGVKDKGGRDGAKSTVDVVVVEVEVDDYDDPNNDVVNVDTDDDIDEVIAEIVSDSSCCSSNNNVHNDSNVDLDTDIDDNLDDTIDDINNVDNYASNDCDNYVVDDGDNQIDTIVNMNNSNNNNDNNDVSMLDHDVAPIKGETEHIDTNFQFDITTTSSTCACNNIHNTNHDTKAIILSSTTIASSPAGATAGLVTEKDDDSIPHNMFDSTFTATTISSTLLVDPELPQQQTLNDHNGNIKDNDAAVVVAEAVNLAAKANTINENVQSNGDGDIKIPSSTGSTFSTPTETTNDDVDDTAQQVNLRRWNDVDTTGSKESPVVILTNKIAMDHSTNTNKEMQNTATVPIAVFDEALTVSPFTPQQQKKSATTILSENPPVVPVPVIDAIRQDDVFCSETPTTPPPPPPEKVLITTSTSEKNDIVVSTNIGTATHAPATQLQDHVNSIDDAERTKIVVYPDIESKSKGSGALFRRECSIKRGQWKLGSKIGVGAFGVVHIGMNTMNGMLMAVKSIQIPMVGSGSSSIMKDAEVEIQLLKSLHHDNIVRYLGAEMDKNYLHIFQEWVPAGSITTMLLKFGPFPILVIQNYVLQILHGLDYLHMNHIMHRDIKGSNVLVTDDGIVKLADFGSSKRFKQLKQDMMMSLTMRGTPYFMAPEVFEEKYSTKADIWSVGCVAVQMITGNPPWKNLGLSNPVSLFQHITKTTGPPQISYTASEQPSISIRHDANVKLDLFKKIIDLCFDRIPENRPSAKELIEHAFFLLDDQNVSMDDTSDCVIGQSFHSPSSAIKRTFKHTTISSSPIWANNLSPINRRAPIRRCNSGGCAIRSPMFSPPLPKRSTDSNINRMDGDRLAEFVEMKPELSPVIYSPVPNASEWPTWAKKKLLDTNCKENFDGCSVSSLLCNESPQQQHIGEKSELIIEPTLRSILAMTADSLAYSDDDDDNENNKNIINNSRAKDGKLPRLQVDILSPPLIGVQISTPP